MAIVFYLEHVEMKEITVKLFKIIKHTFRNTTYSKAIRIYSPSNINDSEGIENGRG